MATVSSVISSIKSFLTSKYLALTGGTLTGALTFTVPMVIKQSSSDSYTTIRGGTTNEDGARIVLCGKGDSEYGLFRIYTSDGTNACALVGKPDGALTWVGKGVVCVESGTSGNFWYRKYADGFIEQGGILVPSSGDNNYLEVTVTLPIAFSNTNYIVLSTGTYTTHLGSSDAVVTKKTTTQVGIKAHIYKAGVEYATFYCCGR